MVQYTTRTRCSGAIPPHLHVLFLTCKIDDVNSLPPEYGICGRQAGRTGPLLVPIFITLLSSCQVPVLVERATDNLHWTVEVVESRVKLSPACSNAASILNRVCPDLACPPGACPHSLAADPQPVIFMFFLFYFFTLFFLLLYNRLHLHHDFTFTALVTSKLLAPTRQGSDSRHLHIAVAALCLTERHSKIA